MPVTAIINLRALSMGKLPRSFHCLMYSVFLDRISKTDEKMGKTLHDAGIMQPFSISPVMNAEKQVVENKSYWVRIGILSEELEETFILSMERGIWREPIQLEKHFFEVEEIVWGNPDGFPWCGRDSYPDMIRNSLACRKISLFVVSPMSFKKGDLHYPLPEPALLFRNLLRRWNQFSEIELPDDCDFGDVSFAHFDLQTHPFTLRKGGTVLGATGKLTFIFQNETSQICHALLQFALYAGIGVKTTQGMGMCRIVSIMQL
ncbi:MAG: CRISPR-associated endoribonuclease Cas6 [Deltaproteobacteria bacterium]